MKEDIKQFVLPSYDTNDTNSVFTVLHHKVGYYNMNKIDDAVNLDYFSLSKIIGSWI